MYNLATQILQPYTLMLLGLAAAAGWAWRRKNTRCPALSLAGIILGLLLFLSTPLAGFLALRSVEGSSLPADVVPQPQDTIVVLSGSLQCVDDVGEQVCVGQETMFRCYHAARLYRRAGRCRMLLTGGKVDSLESGPTLAAAMRDFLLELGIKREDMILEEQSSTTFENASLSKNHLDSTKDASIFLVTDAAHMPRAVYCFETQGVNVIPAPCNYRTRRPQLSAQFFLPSTKGMDAVNDATHEWLGLLWYRLRTLGQS